MKIAIKINFFEKVDANINHTPRPVDAVPYLLAEELVRRRHDVTVFVTSDSEISAQIAPDSFDSRDEDIRFCADYAARRISKDDPRLQQKHYKGLYQRYVRKGDLNIVKQAKNFDIIHTQNFGFGDSLAEYTSQLPIPVVTTLHGYRIIYKNGKISANHLFIAISESQKKLHPFLPIVGIAYNGIKIEDFKFSEKSQDYLAFLGRITPDKGVLEAIEVAKRTKNKLIIAGVLDQNYPDYIKKIFAEIEANQLIQYIGQVGREEKNALLKHAAVLLMPTQWEAFGLVAVEAMACGTPVIALRRGALPEIVKDGVNGFIVDDIEQMCEKVGQVHTISRKKCRDYVEKHFTVATMTDAYEKLYQQIVFGGT